MIATPSTAAENAPSSAVPVLSVVLATYNRCMTLPQTIDSIFAQDVPATDYELIVVVDGSTDGTLEYLRSLQPACALRIIEQPNRGQTIAQNAGIAVARGRIVLFMDDDLVLVPSCFRAHISAHAKESRAVVHGPVFVSDQSHPSLATEWVRQSVVDEIARWEKSWTWPDDANIDPNYSLSRTILLENSGFDERFVWRSHQELGLRLASMGLKFIYEPDAACSHVYIKTTEQLLRAQIRCWGKEEPDINRKHPELRRYSFLALLGTASPWKRSALRLAAGAPISPDFLLRPWSMLFDRFHNSARTKKLGLKLLWQRINIRLLRGAVETVGLRTLEDEYGKRLPILMYHHVGNAPSNYDRDLTITAEQFEKQIRFLASRGYVGIRAADWLAWCKTGAPLPPKPMLLTFDDAYQDLKDTAFPILEQYGFGALVFVVSNCIGESNIWDRPLGLPKVECLSADQILHWSQRGIDFGAHSRTHADLSKLAESELEGEIAGSRHDLEELLGKVVPTFAYPYGHYNAAAAACAKSHFDLTFTTDEGLNHLRTDSALLQRNMVYAWDTPLDLELLVRLGWNPKRRLYWFLRRRLRFIKVFWRRLKALRA